MNTQRTLHQAFSPDRLTERYPPARPSAATSSLRFLKTPPGLKLNFKCDLFDNGTATIQLS